MGTWPGADWQADVEPDFLLGTGSSEAWVLLLCTKLSLKKAKSRRLFISSLPQHKVTVTRLFLNLDLCVSSFLPAMFPVQVVRLVSVLLAVTYPAVCLWPSFAEVVRSSCLME